MNRYPYISGGAGHGANAASSSSSARGLTAARRLEMEAEMTKFEAELRLDMQPPQQHQPPPHYSSYSAPSHPAPPPFVPRLVYSAAPQIVRQQHPSSVDEAHQSYLPAAVPPPPLPPPPPPPLPPLPSTATAATAGVKRDASYVADFGDVPGGSGSWQQHQQQQPPNKKKKRFVRTAGGQVWEDTSLADWDPNDFRIFCGDLGNEVNDDVLTRAFNKYASFQRAKVVRDHRSNKSKGYGFVSFKDPQDFVRALHEMNGKYVGNRPIKLRRSTWKERDVSSVKKKVKEKRKMGLKA